NTELMYETIGSLELYNTRFNFFLMSSSNTDYCDSCYSSKNLFGCISLGKEDNCILNKQYSEKDYKDLREKIIKQMTKEKEYGEFWPIKNSPFCYNETAAQDNFPLEKKDAIALGYPWKDEEENHVDKNLPICESCGHNFNIIDREKKFYAEKDLNNPTKCFKCRHRERLAKKNPRHLWHRQCECTKPDHDHTGRCPNEFETTYSPKRKELVYCENCYNKEIY
ncbi:zinc-ribbon domain-containing protein, partial [Patescibacteria group bacterium]|nr:zinc-ribbon domain-containing protein [Patescibacteria group bacterium]MBU1673110.1 zinc-ribbon domain-containing protein [Patescibacteria group bacterium]